MVRLLRWKTGRGTGPRTRPCPDKPAPAPPLGKSHHPDSWPFPTGILAAALVETPHHLKKGQTRRCKYITHVGNLRSALLIFNFLLLQWYNYREYNLSEMPIVDRFRLIVLFFETQTSTIASRWTIIYSQMHRSEINAHDKMFCSRKNIFDCNCSSLNDFAIWIKKRKFDDATHENSD